MENKLLDRRLSQALDRWNQQWATRELADPVDLRPLAERVSESLEYHLSRWRVDSLLRAQEAPQKVLDEARLSDRARVALDDARFQLIEDGVHAADRKCPWSMTVFVPFAFWDDDPSQGEVGNPFYRQKSPLDEGLRAFFYRMGSLFENWGKRVHEAGLQPHVGELRQEVLSVASLTALLRDGWVSAPFETWNVADRVRRFINVQEDWIRAGVIPFHLSATHPEGLGLLQDLLKHYLIDVRSEFNNDRQYIGLPSRRIASMRQAHLSYFDLWSSRQVQMSQLGRLEVNALVQHYSDRPMFVDIESRLVVPDLAQPNQSIFKVSRLQMQVHSAADLAQIQGAWVLPGNPSVVSHWSTLMSS